MEHSSIKRVTIWEIQDISNINFYPESAGCSNPVLEIDIEKYAKEISSDLMINIMAELKEIHKFLNYYNYNMDDFRIKYLSIDKESIDIVIVNKKDYTLQYKVGSVNKMLISKITNILLNCKLEGDNFIQVGNEKYKLVKF